MPRSSMMNTSISAININAIPHCCKDGLSNQVLRSQALIMMMMIICDGDDDGEYNCDGDDTNRV